MIHKLRQLTATKKFFNSGGHRFGIDQIMRHGDIQILNGHSFNDRPLHSYYSNAELVLQRLPYCTHPAVSQVINIIYITNPISEIDYVPHNRHQVFQGQQPIFQRNIQTKLLIQLNTTHNRQVVTLRIKKQISKKRARYFLSWRIPRTQPFINFLNSLFLALGFCNHQSIADNCIRHLFVNM